MDIDGEKLEQTVLALLHLTSFKFHHQPAPSMEGARLASDEYTMRERLYLESGY